MTTYLAQDYLFVDTFVALMGAAVSHSDSPSARMKIARQLGFVANDEDSYFLRALERLQAPPAKAQPVTQAFIDLMSSARADYASALVVLLVAEWLYLDWATPTPTPAVPTDWLYSEWIDLHRGTGFENWVALLKDELDRVASTADEAAKARMAGLFETAVRLELAFFEAAYA
jgi:thiaminase/transcriptional activator TenA